MKVNRMLTWEGGNSQKVNRMLTYYDCYPLSHRSFPIQNVYFRNSHTAHHSSEIMLVIAQKHAFLVLQIAYDTSRLTILIRSYYFSYIVILCHSLTYVNISLHFLLKKASARNVKTFFPRGQEESRNWVSLVLSNTYQIFVKKC